jgi:outer membrane lipoprotein SlyB
VRRVVTLPGEEPLILARGAIAGDVLGQQVDEAVGELDDAF